MDELIENLKRQEEQQLLDDIIDIYNHKYKDYEEYQKEIEKRINPDIGFTPILTVDTFYYIKNKRE